MPNREQARDRTDISDRLTVGRKYGDLSASFSGTRAAARLEPCATIEASNVLTAFSTLCEFSKAPPSPQSPKLTGAPFPPALWVNRSPKELGELLAASVERIN